MEYRLDTILYATDLGPHGPAVFNHAVGIAQQFGAKIHVVHVVEPMSEYAHSLINNYVPPEMLSSLRAEGVETALREMHNRLEAFCKDQLHADADKYVADMRVVEGMPAQTILAEAARFGAQLIVLGTHGHSALGEMVMGSVAHKVTMKSPIPVLLVPIRKD